MNLLPKFLFSLTTGLVLALTATTAQETPATQTDSVPLRPPRGIYTGNVLLEESQAVLTPLKVTLAYYEPEEELRHYEEVLNHKKVGQEELVELLHKHQPMGTFQIGSNLAFMLGLVTSEHTGKGWRILMAGNRYTLRRDAPGGQNPQDFHFTVITFDVDAKGNGNGSLYDGAKLKFNKKHLIEVSDYLGQPANIIKVQLQNN